MRESIRKETEPMGLDSPFPPAEGIRRLSDAIDVRKSAFPQAGPLKLRGAFGACPASESADGDALRRR